MKTVGSFCATQRASGWVPANGLRPSQHFLSEKKNINHTKQRSPLNAFLWPPPSLLFLQTVPLFPLSSSLLRFATHSGRSLKTGMINSPASAVGVSSLSLLLAWSMAVSVQSEGVKGNRAALMNWTSVWLLLSRQRSSSDLHTGTERGGHKDSSEDSLTFTAVSGTSGTFRGWSDLVQHLNHAL